MHEIVDRVRQITSENERLFARLIEGERRFRGLAKAVWKVQEDERRRLARELHDGLGQTLTALTLQLERLQQKLGEGDARELAADAVETARLALNETRELSRLLRPPVLDDLGLPAALSWLARTLEQRTGLRVELTLDGLEERLDPEVETLVFRLVQEALTNVLRHADVDRATVEV
ncbi:MAG: sensor histidine kinase, partial [Thermoanaerobaculia bacterium]